MDDGICGLFCRKSTQMGLTTVRNIIIFTLTYLIFDFFRREEIAPDWEKWKGLDSSGIFVWNSLIGYG